MVSWDPDRYTQFAAQRSRPFDELVARIGAEAPRSVVDLGCGAGDLTASLARRWPTATVHGIDSSPQMLERAAAEATAPDLAGRLTFAEGDLAAWQPEVPVDVIVTNAALQWVPGHLDLLTEWVDGLAPGGWLALQVPGNFDALSHVLMRDLATEPRFAERLAGVLRGADSVAEPAEYAQLLAETGCTVDAWETTYAQVLDPGGDHGDDAVLAWVTGTGLRPVLTALEAEPVVREQFRAEYAARLRRAYPRHRWGTLFPFRRVFCVAHREENR